MSDRVKPTKNEQTRRQFMATTGAVAGAAALGVMGKPGEARAAKPKRGGTLRFATRVDGRGLDLHRNIIYYVSNPLAATTQGLLDLNGNMEVVAGICNEWDISDDLKTYTFRIQNGVEFHNGATVDAAAVKWNYERIMDPKTSHSFTRGTLKGVESIKVDDKYTLRIQLEQPSAVFLSNVVYYPCSLIAPNSADQADTHPIG